MREDDGLGHYVPILRRIIVLVAVIIAVPIVLWTITVFVRTYVGPPRLPTFHQLVSTASINGPSARTGSEGAVAAQDATARSGPIVEANASTDPADSTLPAGSTAGDRPADQDSSAPGASRASVFPPSPLAASDGNAAVAAAQPAANAYDTSESLSASQPLSGPIPLPRRRPREAEMRTADNTAPANVPMPRRRPEGASANASPPGETTGSTPLGFIQNVFH
jgi:hypothetical protein